ncbi:MAG TPA: DNA mismatch repair protein MutS [Dehalococcoidia bacterium]|nr:DNA mismatch repair protein MutS [Dehalococcoidia bacterium]
MPITPLRRQYLKIKQRYPEAIVFFRLGDFYETFDDDAKTTARELEITLTSREMGKGQRVPMAGIPHHALDNYLARLINKGYKVAICEQMSPPGRGLVERDVIRVITPGTVVEPGLLCDKSNNYLVSLLVENGEAGISYVDITTGEFATTQLVSGQVSDELERLHPAELLLPQSLNPESLTLPRSSITRLDDYWFDLETAEQALADHFAVSSLEGYGCAHLPLAIRSAAAILHYLKENQKTALGQIDRLTTYSTQTFMVLDAQTKRNLEIFTTARWGATSGSLLSVIDLTTTAMGGRLLKKWLGQPLLDIDQLAARQEAVAWLYNNTLVRQKTMSLLADIADLERLVNRIRSGMALPRDLIALRSSLERLEEVKMEIEGNGDFPSWLSTQLKLCPSVVDLIKQAIADEPSPNFEQGGVIRDDFSQELDSVRQAAADAKNYLANLERQEREHTGIKSLKVGYNRVFGYYIEVSKANLSLVPKHYIRKQTLVGAERFFTPELKEYESIILNAQDRIAELETAIFRQVCQQVSNDSDRILSSAKALAEIDVFCSLAEAAVRYGYVRPELSDDDVISISNGRHPVVERSQNNNFIPNDTYLCSQDNQLIVLTGPNMSGKSTYLKQVALIVLLAQIGSFVPADSATIGIVDRIFTRTGAQEDIAAGQSTFMVEMIEAANILNNATPRSLIILDEIGRGTSTYDGLSIAWAVAEFIHNHPRLRSKTLFATHYHELVELASFLPRAKNFNVAVTEEEGKVIFLRKVVPGGADKSYGIHVAQLAGLPAPVIHRAQQILARLENNQSHQKQRKVMRAAKEFEQQLPLFGGRSPLIEEIAQLDIDSMSPLEAITKLYELKRKAQESSM